MLTKLIIFAIGTFVGWNFPQPKWAALLQKSVVKKWKQLMNKIKGTKS